MLTRYIDRRRAKKIAEINIRIQAITDRLSYNEGRILLGNEPSVVELERERVKLFWKRNDLYAKLSRS